MIVDISSDRRIRLKTTLRQYIPSPMLERTKVINADGTTSQFVDEFGIKSFDKILVDAPCSSERHVLHNEEELLKWAPGRSKANSERQISLLYTALKLCRIGGRIVYSTCSLSKLENDLVVSKTVKKFNKSIQKRYNTDSSNNNESNNGYGVGRVFEEYSLPIGEKTEYGWHILPDNSDGWGPIYLSVIDIIPYHYNDHDNDKEYENNSGSEYGEDVNEAKADSSK